MIRLSPLAVLLFAAAACSSGSDGDTANVGPSIGAVNVVVDTGTGSDAFVQVQVAGARLERIDGAATGNLLVAPVMLTLADPSGEPDALTLRNVPTGEYTALHLLLAPGSAVALYGDGRMLPLTIFPELVVPLAELLSHSAEGNSWIEIGHDGPPPPAAALQSSWAPVLSGRPSGSEVGLEWLQVAAVESNGVIVQWATADGAPLQVEFGAGCVFEDGDGFPGMFRRGDDVRVDGDLDSVGRLRARFVGRRDPRTDGPRLIGRITEVRSAEQDFVMDVLAEVRRGHWRLLLRPRPVLVLADAATIHRCLTRLPLTFEDLQVGQLAKVEWTLRAPGTGLEEVTASEIAVVGFGVPMRPSWWGNVQSVDPVAGRIVAAPLENWPIVVQGQPVSQVDVNVLSTTILLRRATEGFSFTLIGIGDITAGQDRIWWRGVVTGPTSIDATLVIVRRVE